MGKIRELEVTVVSAHNLKDVNRLFGTMSPYAVLWIDSNSKAPTHVAEHGGRSPSWNCVVRMLCREALMGTVAKARLMMEVFDHPSMRHAGTADVLLSELQKGVVWEASGGEYWSQPKSMSLDIKRLHKGSTHSEKVIGAVNIQVRQSRAVNEADETSGGVHRTVTYNGVPIQNYGHDLVPTPEFNTFNEYVPDPILPAQQGAHVYYQHLFVKKPQTIWKGIRDQNHPERLGVIILALNI